MPNVLILVKKLFYMITYKKKEGSANYVIKYVICIIINFPSLLIRRWQDKISNYSSFSSPSRKFLNSCKKKLLNFARFRKFSAKYSRDFEKSCARKKGIFENFLQNFLEVYGKLRNSILGQAASVLRPRRHLKLSLYSSYLGNNQNFELITTEINYFNISCS